MEWGVGMDTVSDTVAPAVRRPALPCSRATTKDGMAGKFSLVSWAVLSLTPWNGSIWLREPTQGRFFTRTLQTLIRLFTRDDSKSDYP